MKKKIQLQFLWQVGEKQLHLLKIILKSPKLIVQKLLLYKNLLKNKRLKFTFLATLLDFPLKEIIAKEGLNTQKQLLQYDLMLSLDQKPKTQANF